MSNDGRKIATITVEKCSRIGILELARTVKIQTVVADAGQGAQNGLKSRHSTQQWQSKSIMSDWRRGCGNPRV